MDIIAYKCSQFMSSLNFYLLAPSRARPVGFQHRCVARSRIVLMGFTCCAHSWVQRCSDWIAILSFQFFETQRGDAQGCACSGINPNTSANELKTMLEPHSIIHHNACFAYFKQNLGHSP